jgi:histidine triad (HIT) family protein
MAHPLPPGHAPQGYACPLCALARGSPLSDGLSAHSDIVLSGEKAVAAISAYQWPNNPGNVIVFPIAHHENLYSIPADLAPAIHSVAQAVALAMKAAWQCDGVSTRQHNEPAGNQDVWHYHLHVTPRFKGDNFYGTLTTGKHLMAQAQRAAYTIQLRHHLNPNHADA